VSVADGVESETLSDIYNMFDVYVQYAICEGFGMPQVEAGACGVPIVTVNYSAMCDIINKLDAMSVEPKSRFKELETKAIRVYPDNTQLHDHIISFLELPQPIKDKKRYNTRNLTEKYYNWDNIAKKWETYFDTLDSKDFRSNWNAKTNMLPRMSNMLNIEIQPNQNFQLITNICQNYLKNISEIEKMINLDLLRDADYGFTMAGPVQIKPFSYKNILEHMDTSIANNNVAEDVRSKGVVINEDFIQYAKMKAEIK
jgi:hypothetical protein